MPDDFAQKILAYVQSKEGRRKAPSLIAMRQRPVAQRYHQGLFNHAGNLGDGVDAVTKKEILRIVVPLMALHPMHSDQAGSFGKSANRLARQSSMDVDWAMGYLSTLSRLTTGGDGEKVLYLLIREMSKYSIPVDWLRLITDLIFWNKNSYYQKWYTDYILRGKNDEN